MDVHKVDLAAAKVMLKNVHRPAPTSSNGERGRPMSSKKLREPVPVALRLWLGKTRNNVHCSLNTVIQRTWAEGASFDGRSTSVAAGFLLGHAFLESVAGRRGVVLATLATILYCGGDLDKCILPDGQNGSSLVKVDLTTFAFVLSKVRTESVRVRLDACSD